MTDLEMVKACAEAMGYTLGRAIGRGGGIRVSLPRKSVLVWTPLTDDAQAMALVKKFQLCVQWTPPNEYDWLVDSKHGRSHSPDLNHAIVECVAKMQAAKERK